MKESFFKFLEFSGFNRLFRGRHRGQIKTLMYHSISDHKGAYGNEVSPKVFKKQIEHLKKHFNILKLTQQGELANFDNNKVNVIITFDDGFKNNYEIAAPILQELEVAATFFLIAECVPSGKPPPFSHNPTAISKEPSLFDTMDTRDANDLIRRGFTIGSHSLTHVDFMALTNEQAFEDAKLSQDQLEELLSIGVYNFAFPWGRCKQNQIPEVNKVYRRIFTTEHGFSTPEDTVFYRNEVGSFYHMCAAASGSLDYFRNLAR